MAGELHNHVEAWAQFTSSHVNASEIMEWIRHGVSVKKYMCHFKGDFAGMTYDCHSPPPRVFANHSSCREFSDFVTTELHSRIMVGAVEVWGQVNVDPPPYLVMPLTVEPTKPRLCHDERYLNLWMRDMPFSLDSVVNLTRYVEESHFQTKLDDKSGYDHVLLDSASRPLVGFQWGGWWLVNKVLPFGWKISPYVYQTIGMAATHTLRSLCVPCSQYIDDRHLSQLQLPPTRRTNKNEMPIEDDTTRNLRLAYNAVYMACSLLTSLGYFLNLKKSSLIPSKQLTYLGLTCDSALCTFHLPRQKIERFKTLRESILSQRQTPVSSLQKMIGKCISFTLVVPGAKLFTREMGIALSQASKRKGLVEVKGPLRHELEYWRFLDEWKGHMPWFKEHHMVVCVTSDASGFGWGGTLANLDNQSPIEAGDLWEPDMLGETILIKEAVALLRTLQAFRDSLRGLRVNAWVDNKALVESWNGQYSRSPRMLQVLKDLFWITVELRISLSLYYIASKLNPADKASRRLTASDSMLSPKFWNKVQARHWGCRGHTVDLLSLDSNAQKDVSGPPLPHFAPWKTPAARGVNVFSQTITYEPGTIFENCYAFPPLSLIGPFIRFLKEQRARGTLVVPVRFPREYWWPILTTECHSFGILAHRGECGVLLRPTKQGFVEYGRIPWGPLYVSVPF